MTLAIFWASVAILVYALIGFPALVIFRAWVRPRPYHAADGTPRVSIVIAARNEEASIPGKLANLLTLDYPMNRLEVVIASDGSEDATVSTIQEASKQLDGAPPQMTVLDLARVGKAKALEAAVVESSGEILAFTDANSMLAPDALRALVRPFADSDVGGVAGNQVYVGAGTSEEDALMVGERGYWSFDRRVKEAESRAGNVISATGALYAIRRELFHDVPVDATDDFAISTAVIAQGARLVFAPDAVAFEPVAPSGLAELGRKVRIITRGLRGVIERRALLNPIRYGFYSVQLFSHKVLRRLTAVPLLALLVTSPLLWHEGALYVIATVAQAALYGAGLAGLMLRLTPLGRAKPLALPAFFILVNVASVRALWNLASGRRLDRWEPTRARTGQPHDLSAGDSV